MRNFDSVFQAQRPIHQHGYNYASLQICVVTDMCRYSYVSSEIESGGTKLFSRVFFE